MRFLRKCRTWNGERGTKFRSGPSRLFMGTVGLLGLAIVASAAMNSCASKEVYIPVGDRAALEKQRSQEAGTGGASTAAGIGRDGISVQDITEGAGRGRGENDVRIGSLTKDIYFDFDSYKLKSEDFDGLKNLSAWLKTNKRSNLTVEGHCDERGSIEYNMALGQKRAEAVREYLLTTGVETSRVKSISYGKETPADAGHTEEAWAKNRRAHMRIE